MSHIPWKDIDTQLAKFSTEIDLAIKYSHARLGTARLPRLGDINLRDEFYREMTPLWRNLYHDRSMRRFFFGSDEIGQRSRKLLLVWMSELVYWEYENSFWNKIREVLRIELTPAEYSWFTDHMTRGYKENQIHLMRSLAGKQYVRTIIAQSGFSRQLVDQAKHFTLWFFDTYPTLDPRTLDSQSFESIFAQSSFQWAGDELLGLLREMVSSVSTLLREIRKRSLVSADLADPLVLNDLEKTLGFHPIRGIFGFRKEQDIRDLLEKLCIRVKPDAFRTLLERKIRTGRGTLFVTTPDHDIINVRQPDQVPVTFGTYTIRTPFSSEVQVVPREALPLSLLSSMLKKPKRVFHEDGSSFAWMHDSESFQVYHGSWEPEEARAYRIDDQSGYLWYGKRKVGIPLKAEREDTAFAELKPRQDVELNPRIRLVRDPIGIEVVVPSFVCYEPRYAGQVVRLELNGRPFEDTTYVINREGSLQFQSTRASPALPNDQFLKVRLVTAKDNSVVVEKTICPSMDRIFLFNRSSRELVSPGEREYESRQFVLFAEKNNRFDKSDNILMEDSDSFGPFQVRTLTWETATDTCGNFRLEVGAQKWEFTRPLEVYATLQCEVPGTNFKPQELNTAFAASDIRIQLELHGNAEDIANLKTKLSVILEKDEEFLTDYGLSDLENMGALVGGLTGNSVILAGRLIEDLQQRHIIDRAIGSYRWTLMSRPDPIGDLEPLAKLDFTLLPTLQAHGLENGMAEGKEEIITISCPGPLLIDSDDSVTDVLPIACKPEAYLDSATGKIEPRTVEKTIRLAYPPVKLKLSFIPRLFSTHLVSNNCIAPHNRVTFDEAQRAYLAFLVPDQGTIIVRCNGKADQVTPDSKGHAAFPFQHLLSNISAEHTVVEVSNFGMDDKFDILWPTSVTFIKDECRFIEDERTGCRIILTLRVDGPGSSGVVFKIQDNRFRSFGTYDTCVSELKSGQYEVPIDLQALGDAKLLFCTAYNGELRQDAVTVSRTGEMSTERTTVLQEIQAEIHTADPWKLLELLSLTDALNIPELTRRILADIYSPRCLEQIYLERGKIELHFLTTFFARLEPSAFPKLRRVSTAQLKKYGAILNTELQVFCAGELIKREDGNGVEIIIDLLSESKIEWERAKEVFSYSPKCTSEMIHDMTQWDALENRDDSYIDLMGRICELFDPTMVRAARASKDWKRALALRTSGDVIEAKVVSRTPFGLRIAFGLLIGDLPLKEVDHRMRNRLENCEIGDKEWVGKNLPVVILEASRQGSRLIFSETRAIERRADAFLKEVKIGDVRTGTVCRIVDSGVLVDLGGIKGLVPRSELPRARESSSAKLPSLGEQVQVYVSSIDPGNRRIELSMRKSSMNTSMEKYIVGQQVQARVRSIGGLGIYVLLDNEIDGFVPTSELLEIDQHQQYSCIQKNQLLTLVVLRVDLEKCRLELSQKQVGKRDLYWGNIRIRI